MTIMFWILIDETKTYDMTTKIYLHEILSSRFIRCKILKFVLLVAILSSFVPSLSRRLRRGRPHRLITSGNSFIVCKKRPQGVADEEFRRWLIQAKKIIRKKKNIRLPSSICEMYIRK